MSESRMPRALGLALIAAALGFGGPLVGVGVLSSIHRNHPYSAEWDAFVIEAMDRGDFRCVDGFHADVGGVQVWTKNYPYAYGLPGALMVMPSRATVRRMFKEIGDCSQVLAAKSFREPHP